MYAKLLKENIDFNTSGSVALLLAEPLQGAGGINPLPDGFLNKAAQIVRDANGLYASDEV